MKGRILVVDDEPPICLLLKRILNREGHETLTAPDFDSAIAAVTSADPHLIISDIVLGEATGLDLLMAVRRLSPTVPVVMITGHPTIESAALSVREGAFDYLVKPVEKERLLRVVDIALRHKAAIDQAGMLEAELRRQRRLYERIVEDQTDLICRFNVGDGRLTFVNDAYANYFGKPKSALLGADFLLVIPESDRERVRKALSPERIDIAPADLEHRAMLPDGRVRWQSWRNRLIRDAAGNPSEIQSVGRDITDRKQAEESLAKSRMELEAVFQNIPEGLLMVDGDMTVIRKNRTLAEICPMDRRIRPGLSLRASLERQPACGAACVRVLADTLENRRPERERHFECNAASPPHRLTLTTAPMIDGENSFPNALLVIRDITRLSALEERLKAHSSLGGMVGASEKMRRVYGLIGQLAELDNTVLITGESGTGKELVMEALHQGGPRAAGPLVRVNCAALPEQLLQSELFGHVRGAFTGALRDRMGRFEAAQGGTLFLDEIGDLPPHIQLKLLRVLERKEFERVGQNLTIRADARIIAATHQNLAARVRQGLFREDFFYRINVMNIHLPPLRERLSDIPLLVDHFLGHFGRAMNKRFSGVTDAVMARLMGHRWPGNVRELEHLLEYACILCPEGAIDLEYLTAGFRDGSPGGGSPDSMGPGGANASATQGWDGRAAEPHDVRAVEFSDGRAVEFSDGRADRLTSGPAPGAVAGAADGDGNGEVIRRILLRTDGNRAKAARMLGISRSTLYRRMRELNIP